MSKTPKVMMTLAIAFAIVTFVLFVIATIFFGFAIDAIFNHDDMSSAIGGGFLSMIAIMFSVFSIASSVPILPFAFIYQSKNGKATFGSISFIVFAIIMILAAIFYIAFLPAASAYVSSTIN